ncbi:TetR/AcrR family transcriptional regulator [Maritimibacter sp. 55A14]|uniref:TetR/AcrR family transcriptional regulator n=1 Tax=Maritimibacter sp. 55A14 TaxID=2174844 RepID=UPI0013048F3D|nr:TetR/AcrR family transcriptional regulator [Maritimibacter sp. 55A14]
MRAFWAQGYGGTSVADLVAATGINRGSLYSGFTDKRTLFLTALRHYDRVQREEFLARLARENPPREAILAAFAAAARSPDDTPPGCLLVNTALEVSPHDAEVRAVVNEALAGVEGFFADRLEALETGTGTRATVQALLGLFLGLRVLTRAGAPQSTREAVSAQVAEMLG